MLVRQNGAIGKIGRMAIKSNGHLAALLNMAAIKTSSPRTKSWTSNQRRLISAPDFAWRMINAITLTLETTFVT